MTESRKRTITTGIIDVVLLILFIGAAEPRPKGHPLARVAGHRLRGYRRGAHLSELGLDCRRTLPHLYPSNSHDALQSGPQHPGFCEHDIGSGERHRHLA